jgi:hypothetical protein
VLVDGPSRRRGAADAAPEGAGEDLQAHAIQWGGRTPCNKIVHFSMPEDAAAPNGDITGRRVFVRIEDAFSHSLRGRPVFSGTHCMKGEKCYAA